MKLREEVQSARVRAQFESEEQSKRLQIAIEENGSNDLLIVAMQIDRSEALKTQIWTHEFVVYCLKAGYLDGTHVNMNTGEIDYTGYLDKLHIVENMLQSLSKFPESRISYLLNGNITEIDEESHLKAHKGIDASGNTALGLFEIISSEALKEYPGAVPAAIRNKVYAIKAKIVEMGGVPSMWEGFDADVMKLQQKVQLISQEKAERITLLALERQEFDRLICKEVVNKVLLEVFSREGELITPSAISELPRRTFVNRVRECVAKVAQWPSEEEPEKSSGFSGRVRRSSEPSI